MKTNQTLTRKMGNFNVLQRTSDGYFDGNALLQQWNGVEGNPRRRMSEFLEQNQTKEFLDALLEELQNVDNQQRHKIDNAEFQLVIKAKGRNTQDGRTPDKIWMHPYLFIEFAMWINPRFKVKVIKFVYDQLIRYRNDAGDAYREMSGAIVNISSKGKAAETIQKVAQALNFIIYGRHETDMRNKVGEESKARELYELERDVTKLINGGFITSCEQLVAYLRKLWADKYQPKILTA